MIRLEDILREMIEEKEDRCLRITRCEYDEPSTHRSGAIVRCGQGKIWEGLKEANVINVPEEVLSKLDDVYEYTKSNLKKLKNEASQDYEDPLIVSKYNKIFKFNDLSGKEIQVSIGYYNNPDDLGAGRMDTINDVMLINLAFFGDKENFLELGEHELVHAMDPKVRDVKLMGREFAKKGAAPDQMDKYLKSPWEFDAFTSTLINKLKKSRSKLADKSEFDDGMKQLLSALKNKSVEDIISDDELRRNAWFFSNKEWKEENWPNIAYEFQKEIERMKTWTSKPSLYKRFLQRYANVVLK